MNERDRRIVERLCAETLPLLSADLGGKLDLCVLATKTGTDVLRYFGIDAKPMPVVVAALNGPAVDWIESDRELPSDYGEEAEEFEASGAWIVQIDERDLGEPGRYPGHLVVSLPRENAFLDLSLGQFARPEKGILVPPGAMFDLPEGFADERGLYSLEGGGALVYEARKGDRFRSGADWKQKSPYSGALIRSIRADVT